MIVILPQQSVLPAERLQVHTTRDHALCSALCCTRLVRQEAWLTGLAAPSFVQHSSMRKFAESLRSFTRQWVFLLLPCTGFASISRSAPFLANLHR